MAVARSVHAGTVVAVGHGFGNGIVRRLAALYPDEVAGVVAVNAGGKIHDPDPRVYAEFDKVFDPGVDEEERRGAISFCFFAGGPVPADWIDGWWPEHYLPFLAAQDSTPEETWWTAGDAPILIIQGLRDRVAPPENGYDVQSASRCPRKGARPTEREPRDIAGGARSRGARRAGIPRRRLAEQVSLDGSLTPDVTLRSCGCLGCFRDSQARVGSLFTSASDGDESRRASMGRLLIRPAERQWLSPERPRSGQAPRLNLHLAATLDFRQVTHSESGRLRIAPSTLGHGGSRNASMGLLPPMNRKSYHHGRPEPRYRHRLRLAYPLVRRIVVTSASYSDRVSVTVSCLVIGFTPVPNPKHNHR